MLAKRIAIDAQQCDGCGACIEACVAGAIYLVERTASIDHELCNLCQSCIAACPQGAISLVLRDQAKEPEPTLLPVSHAEPEAVHIQTRPSAGPLRTRVMPLLAGVVTWTAREIVPRLAGYVLENLDRRLSGAQTTTGSQPSKQSGGVGGRQRRRRRRGG